MPDRNKRIVVCAAIRKDDLVICGVRHFDEIMRDLVKRTADSFDSTPFGGWEQGFVDNKRQFMTREEAFEVASNAGQVDEDKASGGLKESLISEDLY